MSVDLSENQSAKSGTREFRGMLNERQVAERHGFSLSWLRIARVKGNGPAFIKIGAMVRYRDEDVEAFIARHRVTSTSQVA